MTHTIQYKASGHWHDIVVSLEGGPRETLRRLREMEPDTQWRIRVEATKVSYIR